ncbi:MAG: ABC transporter permease [Acidobacteriota bacterium]
MNARRPRRQGPGRRASEWLLSSPSLLWLTVLVLVPTAIVFLIALRPPDVDGGIGAGWSAQTLRSLARASYARIAWRTVYLSFLTTVFCMLLAVPCGYLIGRADRRWRQTLLLLVVIPFWTSFLIRIFAWKVLLHPDGAIKAALVWLGLVPPAAGLLYNAGAVLLVMVYTSLPFAILPVYAAAEKFDYTLIEAARDLGASPLGAFARVFVPGVRRGLLAATLLVFIPSLGSYIIPDLVGSPSSEMLGNVIAQRVFVERNLPHASALAAVLTAAVLVPMLAVLLLRRNGGASARTRGAS